MAINKTPVPSVPFDPQLTLPAAGPEPLAIFVLELWEAKSQMEYGQCSEIESAAAQLLAVVNLLKALPKAAEHDLHTSLQKLAFDVVDLVAGTPPTRILKTKAAGGRPINPSVTIVYGMLGAVLHLLIEHGKQVSVDEWAAFVAGEANRLGIPGPRHADGRNLIQPEHVKYWRADVSAHSRRKAGVRANRLNVTAAARARTDFAEQFRSAGGDPGFLREAAKSAIARILANIV